MNTAEYNIVFITMKEEVKPYLSLIRNHLNLWEPDIGIPTISRLNEN